ncbi:hypothetical protein SPSIL_057440 [Sporomusa silvacetica DSM 10669]|uniref:Uncharacterized protein n=1 Tax=Sporomusa silvacetica DSM 10669 TaxID=1123289 RepID=A0ABZ3IVB5_9FIRM
MIVDIIANPDYRFLEDFYYATGGFKHGDYIVKRPRETLENYEVRKQLSYYLNYVKPVVDSHVNPIFRTEAARDWGGRRDTNSSNLFSLFCDNVDTVKTKLPKFMKRAARIAKLLCYPSRGQRKNRRSGLLPADMVGSNFYAAFAYCSWNSMGVMMDNRRCKRR